MYDYELIRSDRRTAEIQVHPDNRIIVRAPLRLPKREIDAFVEAHTDWIEKHLALVLERESTNRDISPEERQRLITAAQVAFPLRVNYYAQLMHVKHTGIRITGAGKRFGSCSARNSLCFSWRLMLYPAEAIDYVVVHELAHIRYKNHGPDFYAFVASVLPDYKERIKLLKV